MSQLQVNRINDSSGGVLAPISSVMRNRIINGAMVIDQRNAGASVTPANAQFSVDRWQCFLTQASKYSVQQSTTAPTGFVNSLLFTSLSAFSVASGDTFYFKQAIEGLNIGDLAWGTANAKTVTLSFQVYSSLTGTFGGALFNSAGNRSYPFSYTISSSNTWTTISVTIAGDTSGTWLTTNGIGINVVFGLGSGSTFTTTANAWAAGTYVQPTGTVSLVGTNGATFYITGVQLEVGTQATSFEYRQYGTELALCQRYYSATKGTARINFSGSSQTMQVSIFWSVPMRTAPTTTGPSGGLTSGISTNTVTDQTVNGCSFNILSSSSGDGYAINRDVFATAEL